MHTYTSQYTQALKETCAQVLLDVGRLTKTANDRLDLLDKILPIWVNTEQAMESEFDLVAHRVLSCPEKKGRVLAIASLIEQGVIRHEDFIEMSLHDCGRWRNRHLSRNVPDVLMYEYAFTEETFGAVARVLELFRERGGVLPD